jgi:hypothetical protein
MPSYVSSKMSPAFRPLPRIQSGGSVMASEPPMDTIFRELRLGAINAGKYRMPNTQTNYRVVTLREYDAENW